jgi:hypothetical protein
MPDASRRFSNELRYRHEDHPAQAQLTPGYVLGPVREALGGRIGLDPCTEPDNPTGALRFYCPPADGAVLPWDAGYVFCNPPYGKARERWVRRCALAAACGSTVILLMPAATDTRIFQEALSTAAEVIFIRGRLKFGTVRPNLRQAAASHPSALIAWNVAPAAMDPCASLGLRVRLR